MKYSELEQRAKEKAKNNKEAHIILLMEKGKEWILKELSRKELKFNSYFGKDNVYTSNAKISTRSAKNQTSIDLLLSDVVLLKEALGRLLDK